MEITPFQDEVVSSAWMFLPPIQLPLPEALTTSCFEPEPSSGASPAPGLRLCSSHKEGPRGSSPTSLTGLGFFFSTAREGLAERSCCGSGYGERWAVLGRWLTLLCEKQFCTGAAQSWLCCRRSRSCLPAGSHTRPHRTPHSLPQLAGFVLAGWEHTQLGARGQPVLLGHFSLASPEHNPATQTLVLDQPAPVCFPRVRRAGPGQPA